LICVSVSPFPLSSVLIQEEDDEIAKTKSLSSVMMSVNNSVFCLGTNFLVDRQKEPRIYDVLKTPKADSHKSPSKALLRNYYHKLCLISTYI
jgi:hypothetical protein